MQPTIEKSDHGYWVRFGNRLRFVPATAEELARLDLVSLEKTKRSFKRGTHEKSYYYRDEEGNICIPPDPKEVPAGVRLEEIDSLASADRVSKEMAEQHRRRFQGSAEFTEALEKQLGSPRQHLVDRLQNAMSNYERDLCREMIAELDNGKHDLSQVQSDAYFHWRES
jgi:hypothetical protein